MSVLRSRVVDHPLKIHAHGRLVADDSGFMIGWQQRPITRMAPELGAVVRALLLARSQ